MDQWIEFPPHPTELVLTWRPPESVAERKRIAVGKLIKDADGVLFRYYDEDEILLENDKTYGEIIEFGYAGYPAFDFRRQPVGGFRSGVIEAFSRRLPPRKRPDYTAYLEHFRVRASTELDIFQLLSVTGGRLPSDGFALVDRLDRSSTRVDSLIEVAGFRYYSECAANLAVGDELKLQVDDSNMFDPNAVAFKANGAVIGHVSRFQAATLRSWLENRQVLAWLARRNGSSQTPNAFALIKIRDEGALAAA